jgi:predicted nucleic acid-binding protein
MILVDSSVWIDYFRGVKNWQADYLDALLGQQPVLVGDLMLAEVLQGFRRERDFEQARELLLSFELVEIGGVELAIAAAGNYRKLVAKGVSVRKTVDCLIATRCITSGYTLLHRDRDFDAFARYLGLRVVKP